MGGLLETLSTWIDSKTLGDIALAWSGRLAAAAFVCLIGRMISRNLWFRRPVGPVAVRPRVGAANDWTVRSDLIERIESTLADNGLLIPFPQRHLHVVSQPAAG